MNVNTHQKGSKTNVVSDECSIAEFLEQSVTLT